MKTERHFSLVKKSNIPEQQLEALYALACELYHTECYSKAANLFRLLCFYQPNHAKGWIGLGGAQQRMQNHEAALSAFIMASFYDPQNPEPRLYAAHSLIDLKNLPLALTSAQIALQLCHYRHNQDRIRLNAELLCTALKNYTHRK